MSEPTIAEQLGSFAELYKQENELTHVETVEAFSYNDAWESGMFSNNSSFTGFMDQEEGSNQFGLFPGSEPLNLSELEGDYIDPGTPVEHSISNPAEWLIDLAGGSYEYDESYIAQQGIVGGMAGVTSDVIVPDIYEDIIVPLTPDINPFATYGTIAIVGLGLVLVLALK